MACKLYLDREKSARIAQQRPNAKPRYFLPPPRGVSSDGRTCSLRCARAGTPKPPCIDPHFCAMTQPNLMPVSWLLVEVGQTAVRVPRDFDGEHLRRVVRVLTGEDLA